MNQSKDAQSTKGPNSDAPNSDAPNSDAPNRLPTAVVKERSQGSLAQSRFWWLALACLIIAVGLVLWSMPAGGTNIQIHFPKGHGLKAEDSVRYRGIDVGVVESIHLTDDLETVDVHVKLFPTAKRLATEGTKFWIVRPRLSISGVSGLDTAVGHKYIQVQPGPDGLPMVRDFVGLASEPVDQGAGSGIEILLQANSRHSVNVGSAIHYRGVDIGRILSVELSPNARYVEVRGKIEEAYRPLVTTQAKFWATGGVDFDFSLTQGLKLETESLDTLARGGVSMLVVGAGAQVSPGHVFPLAASSNEDWVGQADSFLATSAELRGALNLTASWAGSGLLGLGTRNHTEKFSGVGVTAKGEAFVLWPADVMGAAAEALDDSFRIKVGDADTELTGAPVEGTGLMIAGLPIGSASGSIEATDIVAEVAASKWIAVRRSSDTDVYHHLPIDVADIKKVQGEGSFYWSISEFTGDRAVWHGTPVLQAVDSKLVGILLVTSNGTTVQPILFEAR